eukprot:scaffold115285_cov37-Phaeocystis_antarctica.AAC.2
MGCGRHSTSTRATGCPASLSTAPLNDPLHTTQPRHDAQGELKQVLKPLAVLDSCEAAAVWLKLYAAGACGLASLPGASTTTLHQLTAHRSESIHRRRTTVELQHIAALRFQAHEDCVWVG